MKRLLVLLLPLIFALSSVVQGQGQGRDGTSGVAAATIRGTASNPAGVSCAPESTGAVAVRVYSGGFYICSGGVYVAVSGGGGGGGTTINSTDGALPYRVNSTTFGNSGISSNARSTTYLNVTSAASGSGITLAAEGGTNEPLNVSGKGTGRVVLNTATLVGSNSEGGGLSTLGCGSIGAAFNCSNGQFYALSGSTTRPAARFQAASGTSGSQEMLGVYDGSGALAASFSADGSLRWGSSSDTILTRDAANTLAQRNGVNAQAFRVYNTYTDASNYERLNIEWATNIAFIRTSSAGTGTARGLALNAQGDQLYFQTGNTTRWRITSSGHLLAEADSTYDIGASGATRPRHYYGAGDISLGNSGNFYWQTRTVMSSPADGIIRLTNAATTDFDRLQFGGTSASFPALKRSGAGLQVRLADDTAFTPFETSNLTANGWLWAKGSDPSVYLGGSSDASIKRVAPKVIAIMDGNAAAGTVRAVPDSPTQLTADQNNYTGGTGRSLFYRLSSDASRTITGFNPAGGTNQDGELHYFINVGANNIVLANESASSTAANRFTNVTGADITLAANEMAMLVYDTTSARWRVAKM